MLFAYTFNKSLINSFEAIGVGLGLFILIDITRLGSYAAGDILSAGAIGIYVAGKIL